MLILYQTPSTHTYNQIHTHLYTRSKLNNQVHKIPSYLHVLHTVYAAAVDYRECPIAVAPLIAYSGVVNGLDDCQHGADEHHCKSEEKQKESGQFFLGQYTTIGNFEVTSSRKNKCYAYKHQLGK